jgi:HD-GYP domain-containing protein (c-di-GMP phosphodiesterase class II)
MPNQCIRLRGMSPQFKDLCWESDRLLRIGRSRHMEVILDDSSLSRRHAEIALSEAGWVLRDTGSTNGTFLNGKRVGRSDHKLRVNDLVQCGNLVLVVQELHEEPGAVCETPAAGLQVQATTEQSWEQAVELLALDLTRRQRPGEQMLSLLRAGQYLSQVASLDELLQSNVRDAAVTLKAQRAALVLRDETTNKLVVKALFSTRPEQQTTGRAFSSTLAQRCLRTGQSLLCSDVLTFPDLLRAQSFQGSDMNSVIIALLRTPRGRLGVLHLDRSVSQEPFTPDDLRLADAIAAHLSTAIEGAQVLQEKQRSLFFHTVIVLAQAIEQRDVYTHGHAQRVTDYSLLLAEELKLSSADCHTLRIGAPLHDIGKIGIDDAVLRKQGRLSPAELEHMKTHTDKGAAILSGIPDLEFIVPIVRSHHECWDGTGYPDRLAGTRIPRLARLVAVADTFDAMTSDRPYRTGMPADQAFAEIEKGIGAQFDPECASAFLRLRSRVEQLLNERLAIVVTLKGRSGQYDVRKLLAGAQSA